jgi:hypothetical protein
MPKTYNLMADACRDALEIQNACNLSGVLHTWAAMQPLLMDFAKSNASGHYRRHPVNILMLSKVVSLMTVGADCIGGVYEGMAVESYDADLFRDAYAWCRDNAKNAEEAS